MNDVTAVFSRRIKVAKLPRHGQALEIVPILTELASIAAILGVPRVEGFQAAVTVTPAGSGRFKAIGTVSARVWQTCVVTLEDFPADVAATIDAVFAEDERLPAVTKKEIERTLEDEDPPEPLDDGAVDAAALAVEFLALALEPFPRRPGAEMAQAEEPAGKESPFAALAALKTSR